MFVDRGKPKLQARRQALGFSSLLHVQSPTPARRCDEWTRPEGSEPPPRTTPLATGRLGPARYRRSGDDRGPRRVSGSVLKPPGSRIRLPFEVSNGSPRDVPPAGFGPPLSFQARRFRPCGLSPDQGSVSVGSRLPHGVLVATVGWRGTRLARLVNDLHVQCRLVPALFDAFLEDAGGRSQPQVVAAAAGAALGNVRDVPIPVTVRLGLTLVMALPVAAGGPMQPQSVAAATAGSGIAPDMRLRLEAASGDALGGRSIRTGHSHDVCL
jgi:hypothetical protein